MNREQRRAQKKSQRGQPSYHRMNKEQRIEALIKNGITLEDLERNYTEGYNAGFSEAAPGTFKTIYAAICLALHEKYGFGKKRCLEVLKAVDQYVMESLTSVEAIEEVYKRMGLEIAFDDPMDRIKETE